MNEKAKEVIGNVKGVLYVNVDSVYHRITQDELGVLETTINNQEKKNKPKAKLDITSFGPSWSIFSGRVKESPNALRAAPSKIFKR